MILIQFFAAIGASIATVLAELAVALVQIFYIRHQLPLRECFKPIFRYFFLGLGMFLIVRSIGKILPKGVIPLCCMIFIGMITYVFGLVITKDPMLKMGIAMIKKKK